MYLIVTRAFPPELGGMQNLMWGLTNSIAKHHLIKVFADFHEKQNFHKNPPWVYILGDIYTGAPL